MEGLRDRYVPRDFVPPTPRHHLRTARVKDMTHHLEVFGEAGETARIQVALHWPVAAFLDGSGGLQQKWALLLAVVGWSLR